MCGRYQLQIKTGFTDRFGLKGRVSTPAAEGSEPALTSRYNIAPGQRNPVITEENPDQLTLMKWGLVPHWAKDEKIGYKMINARAETLTEKPSFKKLIADSRCIIPASGFYEWKQEGSEKQPYLFRRKDEDWFAFAGLYSVWRNPETGENTPAYTIITTGPNKTMCPIHDRMPVILQPEGEREWLNPDIVEHHRLLPLLCPYSDTALEVIPVSRALNSARTEGPEIMNVD